MMKTAILLAMLALTTAPAFAGEGNGDPFPLRTPGVTTRLIAGKPGASQNPFPYAAATTQADLARVPDVGSERALDYADTAPAAQAPGMAQAARH